MSARLSFIIVATACAALGACANDAIPKLNLLTSEHDPAKIDYGFARSVRLTYGERANKTDVERDLIARGFECADVPPVEARGDYLLARCTRPKPHGLCSDLWAVDLRYAGQNAITPRGEFRRTCVAGASPTD